MKYKDIPLFLACTWRGYLVRPMKKQSGMVWIGRWVHPSELKPRKFRKRPKFAKNTARR